MRTQLLLASLLWTAIGIMLPTLGLAWILQRYGPIGVLFAAPFLALGLAKSHLLLDRISERTLDRVRRRGDGTFAAGFFSAKSWLLVLVMMASGQIIRASGFPRAWLGFIYVAVGTAMLLSSRKLWAGWTTLARV
jgi:hypothetical protein